MQRFAGSTSRRAYVQLLLNEPVSRTHKLDLSTMEAGRGFPSIGWNGRDSTLSSGSKQTSFAVGPATGGQSSGTRQLLSGFSDVPIWKMEGMSAGERPAMWSRHAEKLNTVREFVRTPYNSETLLTATSSGHGKIEIESHGGLVKRFGRVRGSWGYGSGCACE